MSPPPDRRAAMTHDNDWEYNTLRAAETLLSEFARNARSQPRGERSFAYVSSLASLTAIDLMVDDLMERWGIGEDIPLPGFAPVQPTVSEVRAQE
jgi:hypothetical protein